MTFVGSTSLSKAVETMKSECVGILYSGSEISSDEPVSVPRLGTGSIWQTLDEYLSKGTRSPDLVPVLGKKEARIPCMQPVMYISVEHEARKMGEAEV